MAVPKEGGVRVMKVAYLGPPGTYSEEAALTCAPLADHLPCPGIAAAVIAVEEGNADRAVVPIENSLEGAVTQTVDLLIHRSSLRIRGEVVLPIHHCLVLGDGVDPSEVTRVYSHPQALAQCRGFLESRLSAAEPVASLSTADAVRDMLESSRPAAAIASERAASHVGGVIVDRDIEDVPSNKTRFVVLARADELPTGDDRTSICFDFTEDTAGTLHGTLGEFAERGINMIKIESRPDKRSLGRYIFLIDIEGHREDALVRDALERVRGRVSMFRVFGSYPRAR